MIALLKIIFSSQIGRKNSINLDRNKRGGRVDAGSMCDESFWERQSRRTGGVCQADDVSFRHSGKQLDEICLLQCELVCTTL